MSRRMAWKLVAALPMIAGTAAVGSAWISMPQSGCPVNSDFDNCSAATTGEENALRNELDNIQWVNNPACDDSREYWEDWVFDAFEGADNVFMYDWAGNPANETLASHGLPSHSMWIERRIYPGGVKYNELLPIMVHEGIHHGGGGEFEAYFASDNCIIW